VHTRCQTDSTGTLACMATNRQMAYDLFVFCRAPAKQAGGPSLSWCHCTDCYAALPLVRQEPAEPFVDL
jgi:hypothetical protein